ncbi:kinase-like protein [Moniliophthora roreri]|uniref:Protein kinase domain-containing protein n=1 Tax=Moniliophthora roreri TaxID=221103 RepID=A0A0W0F035_MONRR|nr:kinase-like protein [Moniliophthora roreri]
MQEKGGYDTVEDLQAVLALHNARDIFLSLDASRVLYVVELLQSQLASLSSHRDRDYRKRCLKCLRALVRKHHVLPPSLFIEDVTREGTHPLRGGGFSDIWMGSLDKQPVCLKVMRIHLEMDEQKRDNVIKAFCEEALVWKQLNHANILPLLGVNTELFSPAFCLISPWMANGDIISFLRENPEHDRLRAVLEIASGLAYLHSMEPMVIHGDVKGANILVDNQYSCRLADFGLATIKETQRIDSTSNGAPKGTCRWMAPEIFVSEVNSVANSSSSDVYALACTIFEIMTGKPPFAELTDAAVMFRVINRERPPKPTDGWCPDDIWALVERCWSQDPTKRPHTIQIKRRLQKAVSGAAAIVRTDQEIAAESPVSVLTRMGQGTSRVSQRSVTLSLRLKAFKCPQSSCNKGYQHAHDKDTAVLEKQYLTLNRQHNRGRSWTPA